MSKKTGSTVPSRSKLNDKMDLTKLVKKLNKSWLLDKATDKATKGKPKSKSKEDSSSVFEQNLKKHLKKDRKKLDAIKIKHRKWRDSQSVGKDFSGEGTISDPFIIDVDHTEPKDNQKAIKFKKTETTPTRLGSTGVAAFGEQFGVSWLSNLKKGLDKLYKAPKTSKLGLIVDVRYGLDEDNCVSLTLKILIHENEYFTKIYTNSDIDRFVIFNKIRNVSEIMSCPCILVDVMKVGDLGCPLGETKDIKVISC